MGPNEWSGNPLNMDGIEIEFCKNIDQEDWDSVEFDINNLRVINPKQGEFVFVKDGSELRLTRIVKENFQIGQIF